MPKSNRRGGRNNNPTGRNQYSDWGVMEMARERPIAAAAAAAGAAAAGLFLWSKRTQISDQLNHLSDQIGEWRSGNGQFETGDDTAGLTTSTRSAGRRGMSETGAGNASLGTRTGGSGTTGTASGRGRARAARSSETR
jgi:hypothetical protein